LDKPVLPFDMNSAIENSFLREASHNLNRWLDKPVLPFDMNSAIENSFLLNSLINASGFYF
jgi:hypothetical protein